MTTARCPRCDVREPLCLCDVIPRVESGVRFVIVRHVGEAIRSSDTGRLAAAAVVGSELLDYGGGRPFDESALLLPDTWLLYPGAAPRSGEAEPRRLVVLDGTWRQARKMIIKIAALHRLPRLSLVPPAVAPPRLREPTRPDGLSTLEAVAAAIEHLEGGEGPAALRALHAELVRRGLALRGRRSDHVRE